MTDGTFVNSPSSVAIYAHDSPMIDAFGQIRVSNPETLFDSKQIIDKQPLFWDEEETGSGTAITYSQPAARTRLSVSDTTVGTAMRQTFQRFNYQPGKSLLILFTGLSEGMAAGITAEFMYGDSNNGAGWLIEDGTLNALIRTKTSGSVVDNKVAQSDFNVDPFNGSGRSGITIDSSKTNIGFIDLEWLGVGRVRQGFVINGLFYLAHQHLNANYLDVVYMSTPNLPVRYRIENDGTGAAAHIDQICCTVISEGGQQDLGVLRHFDSGSISGLAAGTTYAILGIRLKSSGIGANILMENISMISTSTNDQAHWELYFNPTVAGTFTYSDMTNFAVQTASGSSSNTITGGYEIDGGYFSTSIPASPTAPNALKLGAAIDGTVDEIVLACKPITNNITVEGSITFRQQS